MFHIIQVVTVFLVSVAMGLALVHALELPGKMRLDKETYIAVQSIYYPGFTIGGLFGEVVGIIATLVLLLVTPSNRGGFWLKDQHLKGAGARFFFLDPMKRKGISENGTDNWKTFRDSWEYSHVLRAVFSVIALIVLIAALAM
jgi:hypothetical protein